MSSSSLVISLVHGGILLEDVGSIHLLRQIKRVFQQLNPPALRKLLQEKSEVTKNFRYLKWRNPEPYKAILGMRIPLHKPYPYSLYRWVPPFSVPEIFGDEMPSENLAIWNSGRPEKLTQLSCNTPSHSSTIRDTVHISGQYCKSCVLWCR